ncbi:peptidoglycan DD-metalloendopeptidase family protein [Desulfosarcina ovata]|uniref:peptidoglycan DD-metalloendopeptidase family protein n=1 Tax=Desulfosarcina ovata TaxID=83564 RepID=UPI0012D3708D|nr:peptidoglycan DD-metalloendopeptidase family protein [Desulfosarcina ovata]
MTIYRNPVQGPGAGQPPTPLGCQGQACRQHREEFQREWEARFRNQSRDYRCQNQGYGTGQCRRASFLYPRKIRSTGTWHYHQGIDIGGRRGVSEIVNVYGGTVRNVVRNIEENRGFAGYGKCLVIEGDNGFYYLYAHCDSIEDLVQVGHHLDERVVIARVGGTMFLSSDPTYECGPHLHFEVSTSTYPKGRGRERTLDDTGPDYYREDPLLHLESLADWGPKKFYFPVVSGASDETGHEVNASTVADLYNATESSNPSGFFPLGANNLWHGGVHLEGNENTPIRSPFQGTIVAVRLDPSPAQAVQFYGSTNFILIRHDIPQGIYTRMRGQTSTGERRRTESVGRYVGTRRRLPTATNPPEQVAEVKRLLHQCTNTAGQPYYQADGALLSDGNTVDDGLVTAIVNFQTDIQEELSPNERFEPDGIITIGGRTWRRLEAHAREVSERTGDGDTSAQRESLPPNVVFTLFMHLAPLALEDHLVNDIPWLGRVRVETEDDDQLQADEEDDPPAQRNRHLSGNVGPGEANLREDLLWVQQRLIRLTRNETEPYTGPADGQWSSTLENAIRAFQEAHVPYYDTHPVDGIINPSRRATSTNQRLCMTRSQLTRVSEAEGICQEFVEQLQQRDNPDVPANVFTDIDCRVTAGEVIWKVGTARTIAIPTTEFRHLLHWEIFSVEPLITGWDRIDDDTDDDLTIDVPSLINRVESVSSGATTSSNGLEESQPEAGGENALREDGLLTTTEVRAFYSSPDRIALRQTMCRFCSEWGLNLDNAVTAIDDLGFNTTGLRERLAHYMWWPQVNDVGLPESPLVWHYNPIAFLDYYLGLFPRATAPSALPTTDTEDDADACVCEPDPFEEFTENTVPEDVNQQCIPPESG